MSAPEAPEVCLSRGPSPGFPTCVCLRRRRSTNQCRERFWRWAFQPSRDNRCAAKYIPMLPDWLVIVDILSAVRNGRYIPAWLLAIDFSHSLGNAGWYATLSSAILSSYQCIIARHASPHGRRPAAMLCRASRAALRGTGGGHFKSTPQHHDTSDTKSTMPDIRTIPMRARVASAAT